MQKPWKPRDYAWGRKDKVSAIRLTPTVRQNPGLTFVTVEARRVESTLRVPGRFELLPTATREFELCVATNDLQTVELGLARLYLRRLVAKDSREQAPPK